MKALMSNILFNYFKFGEENWQIWLLLDDFLLCPVTEGVPSPRIGEIPTLPFSFVYVIGLIFNQ